MVEYRLEKTVEKVLPLRYSSLISTPFLTHVDGLL